MRRAEALKGRNPSESDVVPTLDFVRPSRPPAQGAAAEIAPAPAAADVAPPTDAEITVPPDAGTECAARRRCRGAADRQSRGACRRRPPTSPTALPGMGGGAGHRRRGPGAHARVPRSNRLPGADGSTRPCSPPAPGRKARRPRPGRSRPARRSRRAGRRRAAATDCSRCTSCAGIRHRWRRARLRSGPGGGGSPRGGDAGGTGPTPGCRGRRGGSCLSAAAGGPRRPGCAGRRRCRRRAPAASRGRHPRRGSHATPAGPARGLPRPRWPRSPLRRRGWTPMRQTHRKPASRPPGLPSPRCPAPRPSPWQPRPPGLAHRCPATSRLRLSHLPPRWSRARHLPRQLRGRPPMSSRNRLGAMKGGGRPSPVNSAPAADKPDVALLLPRAPAAPAPALSVAQPVLPWVDFLAGSDNIRFTAAVLPLAPVQPDVAAAMAGPDGPDAALAPVVRLADPLRFDVKLHAASGVIQALEIIQGFGLHTPELQRTRLRWPGDRRHLLLARGRRGRSPAGFGAGRRQPGPDRLRAGPAGGHAGRLSEQVAD